MDEITIATTSIFLIFLAILSSVLGSIIEHWFLSLVIGLFIYLIIKLLDRILALERRALSFEDKLNKKIENTIIKESDFFLNNSWVCIYNEGGMIGSEVTKMVSEGH
jgi:pilus assembly protein TadC